MVKSNRESGNGCSDIMVKHFSERIVRSGFKDTKKINKKDKIMMPGMEKDMLNGYALGADDYVTKPFSLPVLYAKAMALTGRARGEH